MEAFAPTPPDWTEPAIHAQEFCCPSCRSSSQAAQRVWVNRRSPVFTEDHRKKWQEFYLCECGKAWWAWSNQRPPSELAQQERELPPPPPLRPFFNPFDE
ncbi:hypothetical protein ACN4EK_30120 [Pantanalinema rosaneae CENA516]|uniref:hypothetical protein n=1 Tax=Pantanalinema rosaneae TaxID=1620701 RepID=UPI003D6E30EE